MWSSVAPATNVRTRGHNIIVDLPGVIRPAKELGRNCSEVAAWFRLITDNILEEVLLYTNRKMEEIRKNFYDHNTYLVPDLVLIEFKAFPGLLFSSTFFKSNNEDLSSIFATGGTGRDIFRCTMIGKRFAIILIALTFDDPDTRIRS